MSSSNESNPDIYYQFEWKPNRNYCVTAKLSCDFECVEAETLEEGDGRFEKFALKICGKNADHGTFDVLGYYKTAQAAENAMENYPNGFMYFIFVWDRDGTCVNGCY